MVATELVVIGVTGLFALFSAIAGLPAWIIISALVLVFALFFVSALTIYAVFSTLLSHSILLGLIAVVLGLYFLKKILGR